MKKPDPHPISSLIDLDMKLQSSFKFLRTNRKWLGTDIRLAIYSHRISVVENILYSKMFERDHLSKIDWHTTNSPLGTPNDSDISLITARFGSFLRVSLVTNYFTSVENFFRIIGNRLYPNLFDEHSSIFAISKKILERFDLQNYACVLDMYRLIRNLSHNNGVYNNEERRFYYDSRVYYFIPNKLVFLNWKLLCDLSIDIEECIFQIINTETISALDAIEDPSSYYLI